uniref:Uncharacterized protein n=1 Tax=Vespula pensylvanica TaxID=30213 RepID=A0A834PAH7_VESPE|nr:hypothetical protein H0235_002594 [Vespula pensylvanica]
MIETKLVQIDSWEFKRLIGRKLQRMDKKKELIGSGSPLANVGSLEQLGGRNEATPLVSTGTETKLPCDDNSAT